MVLFTMISAAFPCAGLLHSGQVMVESDVQQVIFSLDNGNTIAEYRIHYQGDATEFGWVIPTFGAFQSIEERDGSRFAELEELTAPNVTRISAPEPACGSTAKGGDFSIDNPDEDFIQGYTGSFEYVVVPASESASFSDWASENGWETSSIDSILPQYASEPTIELILLRVRQDLTQVEVAESPSLKITYTGQEMRFPAMLGKSSPLPELTTVVYVEGTTMAQVGGWATEEVGELEGVLNEDVSDILYEERLREISQSRASFGVVFSGETATGQWVTRFDSIVTPEQNTHEPFFSFTDDRTSIETNITLTETSNAWVWGAGALALLGLCRKRERRYA